MLDNELKAKLMGAQSVEEVKELLKGHPDLDAEHTWGEIERHRSDMNERLDMDELEAVSGGADRDWVKDGCAASCKQSIEGLCWSNDRCAIWDVTYSNFWTKCPDGSEHEYDMWGNCKKCGYCPVA